MNTRVFILTLVAVLALGGTIGGAFAGGLALGKSQGEEAAQGALSAQSPQGLRQQLMGQGQLTPEQLQQFQQQFQGQFGQGDRLGFAGGVGLLGAIERVEGNVVTVNTPRGLLQATLGAETIIQMSVEGTLEDLKPGVQVRVTGQREADGTVTATTVLINPGDAGGFLGGGFLGGGFLGGGSGQQAP